MSDHLVPRAAAGERDGSSRRRSRPPGEPASDASSCAPRVVSRIEASRSVSLELVSSKSSATAATALGQSASSTAWQYTSTQRCLACGKLGCVTCAARVDPEARRQRLEALKMNTPYERAKVHRVVDEVRTEEIRRRHKIEDQWAAEVQTLRLTEITMRRLVSLMQQERGDREDVLFAEAQEWRGWMLAAEAHSVLAALVRHEKEARYALLSEERTAFSTLSYLYECHRHVAAWARREGAARERLVLEEAARRDRLRATEADGRHTMRAHDIERMTLQELCLSEREAIDHDWRVGVDQLAELAAAHVSVVNEQWAERMELCAEAERGAMNVAREHEFALRRLYDDMIEEGVYLAETAQLFAHQKENLRNMEAAARSGIVEEWVAFHHTVFLQLKQAEEEVEKRLQSKARAREQALQEALRHLQTIVEEEAVAFNSVILAERRSREQSETRMAEKACLREEFVRRCLLSVDHLWQEEEQARRSLCQQQQRDAVGVANWIAYKERQRVELLTLACSEKDGLSKDEHHARFFVLSHMAEHEESVRRRCARAAQERDGVVLEESEQRQQGMNLEALARETLLMLFHTHKEHLGSLAQQRHDQLQGLQRHCLSGADAIQVAEKEARHALSELHQHGLATAIKATAYREQMGWLQQEAVRRSFVVQEEITSRDALLVQARLALRLHEERAMALQQERLHQLESAEHSGRHLIYVEVEEFYEYAFLQQRREEIALLEQLEAQIAAELASRQVCLQEDCRLYDDTESLLFAEDEPSSSGRPDEAGLLGHGGVGQSLNDLKAQLVLQTLGNPSCSTPVVNPVCIDLLATVLDIVGTRRAGTAENLARLERESQALQKKVQSAELQLAREKEKKDDYEARRQREAIERETRLGNNLAEKKREMERWAAEKRRLKDAEEELAAQKKALDALRGNIHRQYKH